MSSNVRVCGLRVSCAFGGSSGFVTCGSFSSFQLGGPKPPGPLILDLATSCCAFRKSYPNVMVVQPRQDWDGYNDLHRRKPPCRSDMAAGWRAARAVNSHRLATTLG